MTSAPDARTSAGFIGLDGRRGADRHEGRRADLAALHGDRAGAGAAVAGGRW